MNQVPVLNFQDFIAADGNELTTNTLKVASVFKKSHKVVLKAVREMAERLPSDRRHYFVQTVEMRPNPSGGTAIPSISFEITQDGFTLLAMGFTGEKALAFKLAYIDAFNAMAAYIKNQREGIHYQCMDVELRLEDSARRGSIHGKGLHLRKVEKNTLEPKLAALLTQAQAPLRFN